MPKVTINTQGAHAEWGNGIIKHQCNGGFTVNALSFDFSGGGCGGFTPPELPRSNIKTDEKFIVTRRGSGAPVANRRYRIELDDGSALEGTTDALGRTELVGKDAFRIADITLFKD